MSSSEDLHQRKSRTASSTTNKYKTSGRSTCCLSATRLIKQEELNYIIQTLMEKGSPEECNSVLNDLMQPYSFASTDIIALLSSTRSTKLRMVMMEQLAHRISDPAARADAILSLFKYAGAKAKVETLLREQASSIRPKSYGGKSSDAPIGRDSTIRMHSYKNNAPTYTPPPSPSPANRSPQFSPTADEHSTCYVAAPDLECPTSSRVKTRRDTPFPDLDNIPRCFNRNHNNALMLETCIEDSKDASQHCDTPDPDDAPKHKHLTPFNIAALCKTKRAAMPLHRNKPMFASEQLVECAASPPTIRVMLRRKSLPKRSHEQESALGIASSACSDIDSSRDTHKLECAHQSSKQDIKTKVQSCRRASVDLLREQGIVEKYRAMFENACMTQRVNKK